MDTGRDLGRAELWQESLERSRARRDKPRARRTGSVRPVAGIGGVSALALLAVTLPNLWDGRGGARHETRIAFRVGPDAQLLPGLQPSLSAHPAGGLAHVTHTTRPVSHPVTSTAAPPPPATTSSTSTATATVVHTTTARTSATHRSARPMTAKTSAHHRSSTPQATVAKASVRHHTTTSGHPTTHQSAPSHHTTTPAHHHSAPAPTTPASQGYVNPFAHDSVTPERIDQGVDYSGSGPLDALGAGTITYVGTANTGWPGAFIEFRLLNGPDSGRFVYYAESVAPASGLHVGQKVAAGQAIATITGGIEVGWGANIGTETYAAANGQWSTSDDSGDVATPSGRSFSALIASLGGPPGIVEG
jgi:hypothetical protein